MSATSVIVSGIKPSGRLHIGNYLGMIQNALTLQQSGATPFYFIADYHALTQNFNPREKAEEIFEVVVDLLAAGLDPERSTIFLQSHVTGHTELAWIFNTITPVGKLQGMIEYREKVEQGHSPNVGLLTYPVLMAADILLYKGDAVPVGEDQRQHLEIAREIARTFNTRFGETFVEPEGIWSKTPRIMSITDPTQKMSKSLPQGCLFLADDDETIREKVKRAVTDSGSEIRADRSEKPGLYNLLSIYAAMTRRSIEEIAREHASSNYLTFKEALAETVNATLAPFRERKHALAEEREAIMAILRRGAEKAQEIADQTMREVKEKVGLI